jgi:type IV pilus assembly protein PilV
VIKITSTKNSGGFTLVEVMVAILIFMVGMLGLLETISVSMQYNLKNQLRAEAVQIGERYMAQLRGRDFDISGDFKTYTAVSTPSSIRGTAREYNVERTSLPIASDTIGTTSRQLTVTVKYFFRNQSSVNRVVSVVSKQ